MSTILECHGLTKRYGGVCALNGAELTLETGRIVGLLGPNGSGKTTLIKLCNGLLTPTAGTLTVDGDAPGKESRAKVAYLPDADYLPDWMTLRDLTGLFRDFYRDFDEAKAREMFASLGLNEKERLKALSKATGRRPSWC